MEQTSYSQRISDLEPDTDLFIGMPEERSGQRHGHNECRLAAAEIASGADARIKELEAQLAEARKDLAERIEYDEDMGRERSFYDF